jgi:hypothetical protein
MKQIKKYQFFMSEREIKDLCDDFEIENYHINDDGSVDVNGDVDLTWGELGNLKKLPLAFNVVTGGFNCADNKLTTLERCPKEVDYISFMDNKLTSLEHSPKKVKTEFIIGYNTLLTSLEGLEDTYIGGELSIDFCENLYSLKGFPKRVGSFVCSHTPIEPIYDTFIQECDYDTMRKFNQFDVIYTDGLDWFIDYDNLGKFLRSVGKEDLMMSMEDFDDFINTTKYKWEY